MFGLYLHIPFCAKVCSYCDFAVLSAPERVHARYVELVLREAELRHRRAACPVVPATAYMGGGTPTLLSPALLDELLSGLEVRGVLPRGLEEFTVECNPENVTQARVDVLRAHGVRRWSLGVQSFEPSLLDAVGRRQSPAEARAALQTLLGTGDRVSADLMFALPGQAIATFLRDLREVVDAGVGHVSFYGLSVEDRTLLGQRVSRGELAVSEDLYADCYREGVEALRSMGLRRYEVSNFARPGEEGVHNRNYWRRKEYLGLGPGAHSFLSGVRVAGPRLFAPWARWVENGCPAEGMEHDVLGPKEALTELVWLSLRQADGLDLADFKAMAGYPFELSFWERLRQRGWVSSEGGKLRIEGEGWAFLDQAVSEILAALP